MEVLTPHRLLGRLSVLQMEVRTMGANKVVEHANADVHAREQLGHEFPQVPDRVIISVYAAYLCRKWTHLGAVRAARRRLHDACAT